jgi:hypothetical protein
MQMIEGEKLRYIAPLKKWRLLDLDKLKSEGRYHGGGRGFRKLITGLEKSGVIKTTRDNQTRRKFVFLTKSGELQLGSHGSSIGINVDNFDHDSRVSIIAHELLRFDSINEVILEHEIVGDKRIGERNPHTPDAVIAGQRKGNKFKMAFELELTQKSSSRLKEKFRHYLDTTVYDYILYFFTSEGLLKSYKKFLNQEYGQAWKSKFMLAINTKLLCRDFKLENTLIEFNEKQASLGELFGITREVP